MARPVLLGPHWLPQLCSRLTQTRRLSPKDRATASLSSLQWSPITSNSKSRSVCSSTEASARRSAALQL